MDLKAETRPTRGALIIVISSVSEQPGQLLDASNVYALYWPALRVKQNFVPALAKFDPR
jgi:hypothetical protein